MSANRAPVAAALLVLGLLWAPLLPGAEPQQPPPDPLAVLALWSLPGDEDLAEWAAAVQCALAGSARAEVLSVDSLAARLGGGLGIPGRRADQERLEGLFQQGYLQSYSFEYRKALISLHRVLQGLDRMPSGPARWRLWIRTKLFEGIAYDGLGKWDAALKAFATVLRTRPEMKLSRREYAPRIVRLWNRARQRLAALPRGRLVVDSEPSGARIELDGRAFGATPQIVELPVGHYHLHLVHPDSGSASRWIEIAAAPARIRVQLRFEGAIDLELAHPGIHLPPGGGELPAHWWPWLGARLGLRRLVIVQRAAGRAETRLKAALVDLERGRRLREAWLEIEPQPRQRDGDAAALAEFLLTGRAVDRLRVAELPPEPQRRDLPPPGYRIPDLPVRYAPRPWYRKWWPYAVAGGLMLAGSAGAHIAADHHRRAADDAVLRSDRRSHRDAADAWLGVAVTGYALGAAAAVTGLVLHLAYERQEQAPAVEVEPAVGPQQVGLRLLARF